MKTGYFDFINTKYTSFHNNIKRESSKTAKKEQSAHIYYSGLIHLDIQSMSN
jgi:hypothetical protein